MKDNFQDVRESPQNLFDHTGNEVISSAESPTAEGMTSCRGWVMFGSPEMRCVYSGIIRSLRCHEGHRD